MLYLDATNSTTVAQALLSALSGVLSEPEALSRVLLLVTDSAAYMHKMSAGLASLLPNMIHVTCLAHGVHRIAESVRLNFHQVDNLVSHVKKVFVKASSRRTTFHDMHPDLKLPPEPVLTRWGSWLEAVQYYAVNFNQVKAVIDLFDPHDAAAIEEAQRVFADPQVKLDVAYIHANYSSLATTIEQLEGRAVRGPEQWKLFAEVHKLTADSSILTKKWLAVLERNKGLQKLLPILRAISSDVPDLNIKQDGSYISTSSPDSLAAFRYAPLTSVDCERVFSRYKSVLRSNRQFFTKENLRRYFVVHCNL